MPKIAKAKILILATDGFEQSELDVPHQRLKDIAQLVHVAAPKSRKEKDGITSWTNGNWGSKVKVDAEAADCSPSFYDALLLPGGVINPDRLRRDEEAMALIRAFVESGKPVAAICHGPWLLIEANAVRGRKMTSYVSIKTDMHNAGADWVDEPVVADMGLITSRTPDDLEAFIGKIVDEIEQGVQERPVLAAA